VLSAAGFDVALTSAAVELAVPYPAAAVLPAADESALKICMLPSPLLLMLWNRGLNMVDVSASRDDGITPAAAAAAAELS
jgi:hypothetical protein